MPRENKELKRGIRETVISAIEETLISGIR